MLTFFHFLLCYIDCAILYLHGSFGAFSSSAPPCCQLDSASLHLGRGLRPINTKSIRSDHFWSVCYLLYLHGSLPSRKKRQLTFSAAARKRNNKKDTQTSLPVQASLSFYLRDSAVFTALHLRYSFLSFSRVTSILSPHPCGHLRVLLLRLTYVTSLRTSSAVIYL